MKLGELTLLYIAIGTTAAAVRLTRPGPPSRRMVDAGLLWICWPLYAPFVWLVPTASPSGDAESALLHALRLAQDGPLANLLPNLTQGQRVVNRLTAARQRLIDLDTLLTTPDFDARAVEARIATHTAAGRNDAAAVATARLGNIQRLHRLRDRHITELEETDELIRQLLTQVELVRLASAPGEGAAAVARDLLDHVDGLDAVLEETP